MNAFLSTATGKVALWAVGAALAASVMLGIVQTLRLADARTELANERRARESDVRRIEGAARVQAERFRETEQAWGESQRKAIDAVEEKAARARADAVLADADRGRLQQRVSALAAAARRAASSSAAAGAGSPAEDAAGMLAELQRRADERAGILARIADERGAAGELCERSYDALTASATMPLPRP